MQLLLPEILAEVRQLSLPILLAGLFTGLALWLAGWWSHRFWIVLGATVAAGLFGLYEASALHMQPIMAALLLAVAAGLLGLSLMRLVAFAAGGLACLTLVQTLVPSANAPLVCFLIGGLIATLLFRLWMMALTSFAGALLLIYCGFGLADPLMKIDMVAWSQDNAQLLNWSFALVTAAGLLLQFSWDRKRQKKAAKNKKKKEQFAEKKLPKDDAGERTIFAWVPFRKAA